MTNTNRPSSLYFQLHGDTSGRQDKFYPRAGSVSLRRQDTAEIIIPTPGLITSTIRGLVPHLARDTMRATGAIRWANVPFESFLEHVPPIPTLQGVPHALHKLLGFHPEKHIITLALRDPHDNREMPANGKNWVSANCIRGVRKVTIKDWKQYALSCDPDFVLALPDIPLPPTGVSQKRLTKSIERSSEWLADMLRPLDPNSATEARPILNIFVHMAGGTVTSARREFANSLREPLFEKEADAIRPFKTLDDGVSGYTFDLLPLHRGLSDSSPDANISPAPRRTSNELKPMLNIPSPEATAGLATLLRASLDPLPKEKPRIAHSAGSPHEILQLIRDVGIDLFDAHWAQRAADIGIALDFRFPAPSTGGSKRDVGHNVYDTRYTHDFSQFADTFTVQNRDADNITLSHCPCIACTPRPPSSILRHSTLDAPASSHSLKPYTRAYLHHLLHTHEMGANVFLASHNLTVLDIFFSDIRSFLSVRPADFALEVERFMQAYDGQLKIFTQAHKDWAEVELARGKGRLAREKEK